MKKLQILLVVALAAVAAEPVAAQDVGEEASDTELAKAAQNPVANMISVPVEYWSHSADNGNLTTLIAKPVIPTTLGKYNLINRFIIPYAWVDAGVNPDIPIGPATLEARPPEIDVSGLADITYQGFLTSAKPSKVIIGVGAALTMPTGKDELSSGRWSAGPSVLVLTMPGKFVIGLLAQNVWDFAGTGDKSVNRLTLQPIFNYNFGKGWYVFSAPIWTANWEKDEKWTIPLGGGLGKLHRFGTTPLDFKLGYYNNVERPEHSPNSSIMFAVKLLIPTG